MRRVRHGDDAKTGIHAAAATSLNHFRHVPARHQHTTTTTERPYMNCLSTYIQLYTMNNAKFTTSIIGYLLLCHGKNIFLIYWFCIIDQIHATCEVCLFWAEQAWHWHNWCTRKVFVILLTKFHWRSWMVSHLLCVLVENIRVRNRIRSVSGK